MPEVSPEVLRWARESAGLSPGEAIAKLRLKAARGIPSIARLQALEEGEAAPTRAMLSKMAAQYRRPLVTFYLEHPPRKGERGTDFRTVSAPRSSGEEALLDALARRLLARQELLKSALLDEDAEPLPFIGSMSLDDGVPAVVASLRETLGLPVDAFRAAQGRAAAFRLLRARVEETGIFVLLAGNLGSHHTDIEVEVFRGMALADEIAPFVVVNPHDSSGVRCFTLLHELAHLWLGQTGVSGGLPKSPVERFCNDVASEYLLPDPDFTGFRSQWLRGRTRRRERTKTQTGGPGYYRQMRHQLGSSLVELTGRLMASGGLWDADESPGKNSIQRKWRRRPACNWPSVSRCKSRDRFSLIDFTCPANTGPVDSEPVAPAGVSLTHGRNFKTPSSGDRLADRLP